MYIFRHFDMQQKYTYLFILKFGLYPSQYIMRNLSY